MRALFIHCDPCSSPSKLCHIHYYVFPWSWGVRPLQTPGMAWFHLLSCLWTKWLSFGEMAMDLAEVPSTRCISSALFWSRASLETIPICGSATIHTSSHLPLSCSLSPSYLDGEATSSPSLQAFIELILDSIRSFPRQGLSISSLSIFSSEFLRGRFNFFSSLYPEKIGFKCLFNN